MQFVTDAWEPLNLPREDQSMKKTARPVDLFTDLAFRHYLALFSALLFFVASPLVWLLTGTWASALLCTGLAILFISWAALLAPGDNEEPASE